MIKYCQTDVTDISAEVENEDIKRVIMLSAIVRDKTLDYCYSLENYENMSLEEKNEIYDRAREKFARIYDLKIG